MVVQFRNPPLLEILVELRWGGVHVGFPLMQSGGMIVAAQGPQPNEAFFFDFGAKVRDKGFVQIERLNGGLSDIPFAPAVRYSKPPADGVGQILYQVGAGLFSANITPPYKNWDRFRPIVEQGILALLDTRPVASKESPFHQVSLRYIDIFREGLTNGLSSSEFMSSVLGFSFSPPAVIQKLANPGVPWKPRLEFGGQLKSGQHLHLVTAEGVAGGSSGVIFDTTVSCLTGVAPSIEDIMKELDLAHETIREVFLSTTHKLHDAMDPVEE